MVVSRRRSCANYATSAPENLHQIPAFRIQTQISALLPNPAFLFCIVHWVEFPDPAFLSPLPSLFRDVTVSPLLRRLRRLTIDVRASKPLAKRSRRVYC